MSIRLLSTGILSQASAILALVSLNKYKEAFSRVILRILQDIIQASNSDLILLLKPSFLSNLTS